MTRFRTWVFRALTFFLIFFPSQVFSADANFYTLNEKWEKQNHPVQPRKDAIEDAFSDAFRGRSGGSSGFAIAPPPTLQKSLKEIKSSGSTVELETSQSLLVSSDSAIVKFVSTEEGIVVLETVSGRVIRVLGSTIGKTFVHVWDAEGRTTFEVRVVPQKFIGPTYADLHRDILEGNQSFKFKYSNSYNAFYAGPKFRDKRRTNLDFNQRWDLTGDTPYGYVNSHLQTERSGLITKNFLQEAQVRLENGRVGPFRDFNLGLGDSDVKPNLMIFSQGRVRGYDFDHADREQRVKLESFYGRELTSILGTISPGFGTQKRTKNSFLSGQVLDYKWNDQAHLKGGIFTGSGQGRDPAVNDAGEGLAGDFQLGPHVSFKPELDFDSQKFARRDSVLVQFEKLKLRSELRDLNQNFETMVGVPSQQGELGSLTEFSAQPFNNVSLTGSVDVFRDRLIPNPDDPGARNVHTEFNASFMPLERSSVLLSYQGLDDTGRIGPTRQKTVGLQLNQGFDLWNRKMTLSMRYANRQNDILNNPLSDYENNQLLLTLYTQIFWDMNFSIQKEWNWLDEYNAGRISRPEALVYTLNYSRQIADTPFYMDANLRIRDEENTESPNSFMTGEDSTEISGGLYYRQNPDMELFLTGRFENFRPESLNVTAPRVEAEFFTGVRYLVDTGYRWSASADVQGYIFKDLNGDGVRQKNEPGIDGIRVSSSDGKEARSGKDGSYRLKSVSGKRAVIIFDNANFPYGFVPTSELRQTVDIEDRQAREINFGLVPRSEVTGIVFNDLDGDGKYEVTDTGIKKVRLVLENSQTARTNGLGVYSFPGVVAGEHTVCLDLVTLPDGYLPEDVPKKSFTLYEGMRYELNFPLQASRAVTGRVYLDKNKNGTFDAGEEALAGVKVLLDKESILSDKEGWYLFDKVKSGKHELSVDPASLPGQTHWPKNISLDFPNEPVTMTDVNIGIESD